MRKSNVLYSVLTLGSMVRTKRQTYHTDPISFRSQEAKKQGAQDFGISELSLKKAKRLAVSAAHSSRVLGFTWQLRSCNHSLLLRRSWCAFSRSQTSPRRAQVARSVTFYSSDPLRSRVSRSVAQQLLQRNPLNHLKFQIQLQPRYALLRQRSSLVAQSDSCASREISAEDCVWRLNDLHCVPRTSPHHKIEL